MPSNDQAHQNFESRFTKDWLALAEHLYPYESIPVHRACRYAMSGRGKLVRPFLTHLTYLACGGLNHSASIQAEQAVEMVHTYSLIHDDLPCMDDDSLRRGRQTVHIEFDEATALLAGDALLSDAFCVLGGTESLSHNQRLMLTRCLSSAIGGKGMVMGQSLDMQSSKAKMDKSQLDNIHINKTGRLIGCSMAMGAICAGKLDLAAKMQEAGEKIGLAFQVIDDLLDESSQTGKSQGKDRAQGKQTYLFTLEKGQAELYADNLTKDAIFIIEQMDISHKGIVSYVSRLLKREF